MPVTTNSAAYNRGRLFLAAAVALFVWGVVIVLPGTLFGMPEMRRHLEVVDMVRQGDLQTLLLFGVFLSTVAAGPLVDRFGNKMVLASSAMLSTIGLLGFAFFGGYGPAQLSGFVLGVGGGGLNMAANVLVSDVFGEDRGSKLNLVAVFFGVGALFIPAGAALAGGTNMTAIILVAAAISAGCAVACLVLKFPPAREATGFSWRHAATVVRHPGVLLFSMVLFFESGNEAAMSGWTSTWAGSLGASVRTATLVLASFQAMMMLGRIAASRVLRVISETQLLLFSGIGALVSMLVIATAHSVPAMAAGAILGGLTFASIYPTVLALAGDRYRSFAGTMFGVLFGIGLSGGMVFPWSIGHLSQSRGFRAGMLMPVFGAIVICGLLLLVRARGDANAADTADAANVEGAPS